MFLIIISNPMAFRCTLVDILELYWFLREDYQSSFLHPKFSDYMVTSRLRTTEDC